MGTAKKLFPEYVQKSRIPQDVKDILINSKISKVEICTDSRCWTLYLEIPRLVSKRWLASLANDIKVDNKNLREIHIKPRFLVDVDYPEQLWEAYWPDLLASVEKISGVAAGWLKGSSGSYRDGVVTFVLPNSIVERFCVERQIATLMENLVWDELGLRINIKFTVEGDNPDISSLTQVQEARVSELLKAQRRAKEELEKDEQLANPSPSAEETAKPKSNLDKGILKGKEIKGETITLAQIDDEEKNVIVQGEVFAIDIKELRSGRKIVSFDMTDLTNSITVKFFEDEKDNITESGVLKKGVWLKVRGPVQYDRFSNQELTLMAQDINIAQARKKHRQDLATEKRVELHLHTKMSSMDGVTGISDMVKTAAAWGHKAIAITDHGVVQAFPEAADAGKKHGVKIIFGLEGYLIEDNLDIIANVTEDLPISDTEFVIFDLETTGFSPSNDEIIEIGAVKIKGQEVLDRFSTFVKASKPLSYKIIELTGINDNHLTNAPTIEEVLPKFREFIGEAVLVAHNATFDTGFLRQNYRRYLNIDLSNPILDTLPLARALFPGLKNHRLNTLAKECAVKLENHHRAIDDAEATKDILYHFLKLMGEREIITLKGINSLVKAMSLDHLRPYHVILLVKNQTGLRNLYKLVSLSHLDYYHRNPRIPKSELIKHREGLIIGSACEAGQLIRAILDGVAPEKLEEIAKFYDYLEIQPVGNNEFMIGKGLVPNREALRRLNEDILLLGDKLDIPVVATGDVHFQDPEDEMYRRILMAGKGFDDADDQAPLYFRTTEEMLEEFSYLGDRAYEVVVKNPNKIAEEIEVLKPIPDEFYPPVIEGAEDEIINMTYSTARGIYGEDLPEVVQKRIDKELNSIINNGFAVLYLISSKLVKKSNSDGYLVGSRGSVGSSFVATMTGITEVNPLPPHYVCPNCKHSEFREDGVYGSGADLPDKDCINCGTAYRKDGHDIPFEVFLGFEGDKVPDIDLNFSGENQPAAMAFTEELFGKGYVFRAGTIGTIAEKTAFGFVKKYYDEKGKIVRNAEINRIVQGCLGVKRTTGQHPGGVMVVPRHCDVHDFTPLQYPADDKKSGTITTHFDYHSISSRLVKLDILGHDDPTVIKMLEDLTGVDAKTIPLDEPKVLSLFSGPELLGVTPEQIKSKTGTYGIPEFGTKFVRQMLEDTKPKTFSELVRISGFSHGTDVWLNNAQDLIKAGTCTLSEAISARDDIMVYLIYQGLKPKQAFKIMEGVRKGKGVKPEDEEEMRNQGVPEWYIESCKKIKYMFPKAHAVAYVMMAFRIAYFKVYYPEAFYATYFTVRADEFDADLVVKGPELVRTTIEEIEAKGNGASQKEKNLMTILELALEMYMRNIKMRRVDLNLSHAFKFQLTEQGILPPFGALQGVGETAAMNIMLAREETTFSSIEDLRVRAKLSKTVIETLEKHGCLEGMTATSQLELF